MTTIRFPCPTCSQPLVFERDEHRGLITGTCEPCGAEYSMRPDGVHRIDIASNHTPEHPEP